MSGSYTYFGFERNDTYMGLFYEVDSTKSKVDMVLRHASIGYYKHIGLREFNLYEVDVDLSPILGKSVTDWEQAVYLNDFMKSHKEPDLDSTKPSFLAQIQADGEHLHILQNDDLLVELRLRHTKFGDKK
jgi:hypothetical protein